MKENYHDFGTDPHKLYRSADPDTSKDAAHSVDTTRLEELVYKIIYRYGERGCTQDDVLANFVGYPYSSITARFKALVMKRLVEDNGERRPGSRCCGTIFRTRCARPDRNCSDIKEES